MDREWAQLLVIVGMIVSCQAQIWGHVLMLVVVEGVEEEEMTLLLLMWVAHRQVRVGWNNDPLETNLRIDI